MLLFFSPPFLAHRCVLSFLFSARPSSRFSSMSSSAADRGCSTAAAAGARKGRLRGVVFDMDGTLTMPVIDFVGMYRAVLGDVAFADLRASSASSGGIDILHHIEAWPPAEKQRANETIAHFERDALHRLQIMPGALELCKYMDSRKLRRGLITRNVKDSVDIFHKRFGLEFAPALSREFRPYKPDPAPLVHICSVWDIPPSEVMMVGDSLRDDVGCGKRAGAFTCLLDEKGKHDPPDSYAGEILPDFKVSSLSEMIPLLEAHFDLMPGYKEE